MDNYYGNGDLRPFKKRACTVPKAERRDEAMLTQGITNKKMITDSNAH